MTSTEIEELEIVPQGDPRWQERHQQWVDSLEEREVENDYFAEVFHRGTELQSRHNVLYRVKDDDYCSCRFGADCGRITFPGARYDVDGPDDDAVGTYLYYNWRNPQMYVTDGLIRTWVDQGRPAPTPMWEE